MKNNNDLQNEFKHLFETYEGEETETSYYKKGQILRGIETPETWAWAVEKFLVTLEWLRHNRCYLPNPNFISYKETPDIKPTIKISPEDNKIQIFQIKEKFAECRCYITYPDHMKSDIEKALGKLEARCELTCAICGCIGDNGEPLEPTKSGWILFACTKCKEQKGNK